MYKPSFTNGFFRPLAAGSQNFYFSQTLTAIPTLPAMARSLVAALADCAYAGCLEDYDSNILLNGGPPGSYTLGQVRNATLPAVNLEIGDPWTLIKERVLHLIMPAYYLEEHADSNPIDTYLDIFGVDEPDTIASNLAGISRFSREGVEQLLILNVEKGRELILAARPDGMSVNAFDNVFRQILSVEALHLQIRWALECSAVLHCPFAWSGLDRADLDDMLRYGPVHRRIMEELKLVERVIRRYQKGENSRDLELDGELRKIGLEARARAVFAMWEEEAGGNVSSLLAHELQIIGAAIAKMRLEMEQVAPPHVQFIKRVANWKAGYDPLALFVYSTNLVVAWVARQPAFKANSKTVSLTKNQAQNGVEQLLAWLHDGQKRADFNPQLKMFSSRQNALAAEAFMLLRFVIIEDDNMIPHKLRMWQDHSGRKVQLQSQADSVRYRGQRFSFDELWEAAYRESGKYYKNISDDKGNVSKVRKRSTPALRADRIRKLRSKQIQRPDDLEEPMKALVSARCRELAKAATQAR